VKRRSGLSGDGLVVMEYHCAGHHTRQMTDVIRYLGGRPRDALCVLLQRGTMKMSATRLISSMMRQSIF
jgi:hypothetical protein